LDGLKQLEDARNVLAQHEQQKGELEKAKELHWDNMMTVQASKKRGCLSAEEKTKVDCQIRAASTAAN
jgi:hypothetical protein